MYITTVSGVMTLVFLCAMILVAKLRPLMASIDRSSYNQLSSGLVVLSFFSLARLYHELGMMASWPLASEATFFGLLWGIGMISGTVFTLSGVSAFLPLARKHRETGQGVIDRGNLVREIEQLVGVESRLDHLLRSTLEHLASSFEYEAGAVYKYSPGSDRTFLVGLTGHACEFEGRLSEVRFNLDRWSGWSNPVGGDTGLVEALPSSLGQGSTITPIKVGLEAVGFFVGWGKPFEILDRNERQTLKIVADIISRKITADRDRLKLDFFTRGENMKRQLLTAARESVGLKNQLSKIAEVIAREIDFEMMSLVIVRGVDGSTRRLTIGTGGSFLDERNLAPSDRRALTSAVLLDGQPFVVTDYDRENQFVGEDMLDSGLFRSALVVPVTDSQKIVATLTLAHSRANRYYRQDARMLAFASPTLARMISDENHRIIINGREKRMARLTNFVKVARLAESFNEIAQTASKLITTELNSCQTRISLVEDHGQFLKSCGLYAQREIPAKVPATGEMIVSLMPCHRLVLESGRQLLVSQADAESAQMPESESSQALNARLSSALIVPIKRGEKVIGMISIAEMRHWERFQFSQADILFVQSLSEILSLAHAAATDTGYTLTVDRSRIKASVIADHEARSRVRSSLTGIMGSLELLHGPGGRNPENIKRYLSIMDSSARKINEYLTEAEPVA